MRTKCTLLNRQKGRPHKNHFCAQTHADLRPHSEEKPEGKGVTDGRPLTISLARGPQPLRNTSSKHVFSAGIWRRCKGFQLVIAPCLNYFVVWVITQLTWVKHRRFGTTCWSHIEEWALLGHLTLEYGTNRFSRNVGA